MVAYSFKRRFVAPIQIGLGLSPVNSFGVTPPNIKPKRQTIRADRRRHARPGEETQLYCSMRTKQCFRIGKGRCVLINPVTLWFGLDHQMTIEVDGKLLGIREMKAFAEADGFESLADMHDFWKAEHGGDTIKWSRVLIRWEPFR